jgi:hypothetical protein
MARHALLSRVGAAVLVAGAVLAVPGAAMAAGSAQPGSVAWTASAHPVRLVAATGASFATAKAVVENDLALRQQRLTNLTAEVAAATDLTSADKATLSSSIASDTSGIDALVAKVPGDTTWAELRADAKAVVQDYRVFVVMSPQAHLAIAADTASSVCARLQAAEPQIEALIKFDQGQGKNVSAAEAAYQSLVSEVTTAMGDVSGVSASVLATTPAAYPGNVSVFTGGRANLIGARGALATAGTDLHTIAQLLAV